ncbi:hypothetical protein BCR43DRAFT_499099 [Syncephalastrum racemosum]|uniref:Armadillo-like helical domain-containing protein n=1 Tax=Syncephalastrum racemosum TaxID=13706 RepID=A0A1X2H1Z0_SYNRA|nr:hypothetical protein BCR43DRAFT_499099 [Syncephalastrum racemosum]
MAPSQRDKPPLKEKFVEITESLFHGVDVLAIVNDPSTFWDEYFMLPVNLLALQQTIQSTSEDRLIHLGRNLGLLFGVCREYMQVKATTMTEQTRQNHAMTILAILIRELCMKKRLSHFNIIQLLTGIDKADSVFAALVQTIQGRILDVGSRAEALRLAIVLVAGNDNVNQNNLNGYFMQHDLSEALIEVIAGPRTPLEQVQDAVMLWSLLANYNKYELRNPYAARLGKCKNTAALERIVILFADKLFPELQSDYVHIKDDSQSTTKSMVSYMTSWFSSPSSPSAKTDVDFRQATAHLPASSAALLLAFYDFCNDNTHFITVFLRVCSQHQTDIDHTREGAAPLVSLLSFASYLFMHSRHERAFIYTRITLITLLRLLEDQSLMNYMAKEDTTSVVRLCRQHPTPLPYIKKPRSLFCAYLDVVLLFIRHCMRKRLDLVSYRVALTCVHRSLLGLKTRNIRLEYHWNQLWSGLISLLHFTVHHMEELKERDEELNLFVSSLMDVFNLCVTFGETFLPDTDSYDSLFYDIIRATEDWDTLANYVGRTRIIKSNGSRGPERSPTLSQSNFATIRAICDHFNSALEEWQTDKSVKHLTPDKVMSVIKNNYENLELVPLRNLEQYIPYVELPIEMGFFRQVLRTATMDYMNKLHQETHVVAR